MADLIKDIAALHERFGVDKVVAAMDNMLLSRFMEHRIKFLLEELGELEESTVPENITDALIDLIVVALGTLQAFQIDIGKAWDQVHEKNMQKVPGANPQRPNPYGLPDLCKPEGWTPPSHADNVGLFPQLYQCIKD